MVNRPCHRALTTGLFTNDASLCPNLPRAIIVPLELINAVPDKIASIFVAKRHAISEAARPSKNTAVASSVTAKT
jgi:hypothetical protein